MIRFLDLLKRVLPILGCIVAALFFLDALTTALIIGLGGYEMNPAMVLMVQNPYVHVAFKFVFAFAVVLIALYAERRVPLSGSIFLCAVAVIYGFVIWNNFNVLAGFFPIHSGFK